MDKYKALVTKGPEAYLEALTQIGWFKQSQKDKDAVSGLLSGYDDNNHFVLALSHLVFDAEGFDEAGRYNEILQDIAALAGLKVLSSKFEYHTSDEGESLQGTITTANGSYGLQLDELFGEWFQPDFIDFINQEVLPGEDIEGRLLDLPGVDQMAQYVFVSEDLYEEAVEKGVIPADGDYFMNDFEE